MNIYTVGFFGHRYIENVLDIESRLEKLILGLLRNKDYVEFLLGRDGEFDQIVSTTIRRCQREYGGKNSSHIWVMPYPTAFFRDNEEACYAYYDEIEMCEESSVKHFKAAFQVRNRRMVDRSDLTVFYVETNEGGAYQTMQYAIQQGKDLINLYRSKEDQQ